MRLFLWIFLWINGLVLQAQQIQFQATTDQKEVINGGLFSVQFTVNAAVDMAQFSPPRFQKVQILGGPNFSRQTVWVNGKRTDKTTFSYQLVAISLGKIRIPEATIKIGPTLYKSNYLELNVIRGEDASNSSSPQVGKAEDLEPVVMVVSLSNYTPYLHEPIVVNYKLLFNQNIRGPSMVSSPSFDGFWVKDIPVDNNGRYESYQTRHKGKTYTAIDYQAKVLIAQRTGALQISAMTLSIPVEYDTGERDFFGQRVLSLRNISVSTGVLKIKVKDLPPLPSGKTFDGLVGKKLNFNTTVDRNKLKQGEALTLKLKVQGKGNLESFSSPSYPQSSQFEWYEPKIKNAIKYTKSGLSGSVSLEQIVVPRNSGNYELPSISITYFDTELKKYISKTSAPIQIEVLEDPNYQNRTATSTRTFSSEDTTKQSQPVLSSSNKPLSEDIAFIKQKTTFQPTGLLKDYFIDELFYYYLLFSPFLLGLFFWFSPNFGKGFTFSFKRFRRSDFLQELEKSMDKLTDEDFWLLAQKAFTKVCRKKFKILASNQVNTSSIQMAATREKIPREKVENSLEVLKIIDFNRFSSQKTSIEARKNLVEKIKKIN